MHGGPLAPDSPQIHDEQQATCRVASDPLNPLVVEWPGTEKVALEAATSRGIVVVSYVGCVMKVLTRCHAGGSYDFVRVTPARERLEVADESELYARLPLGVANLKGELARGRRLELAYAAVGLRETHEPPRSVSGDCRGATHWVRTVTVGAYSLSAFGRTKVGAGVGVAGVEAGGEHEGDSRRLRGQGDVEACTSAGDGAEGNCGAILQLGLAPLVLVGSTVASAGFGEGLAAVTVMPTVHELREPGPGASALAGADLEYLKRLQAAKRADKDKNATGAQRVAAWVALATYDGRNPMRETAEKRAREWREVAAAEAVMRERLLRMCERYRADSKKLRQLLALDDDIVTPKQKAALQKELEEVYAPWRGEVGRCSGASP